MRALVAFAVLLCAAAAPVLAQDPDIDRTGPQLIEARGLPVEIHFVETPDNFVLQMLRIPRRGAPVAFLQHGLLDSADTWLVNARDSSLAYIAYDAGYDVWMGNSRGNKYSRNNTKHSPDWPFNSAFWSFSFDEMAQYDMPTQVKYALTVSGRQNLTYIGHSQGCAQAFANFATEEWSLKDQVNLFVALAPATFVYNTKSVLLKALADLDIDKIVSFLGVHEFLATSSLLRWLLPTVCAITPQLCESVIYLFAGLDLGDLDASRLPVYTAHFPSGTSVQNVAHWAQEVRNNRFSMYDDGSGNPPSYPVQSINSPPIAMFWGAADDLADDADVSQLLNLVPQSTVVHQHLYQEYGHLDFVWGAHANTTIYNEVVALLHQYNL